MKDKLISELEAQVIPEPNHVSELCQRAAQEILRLRGEVMRMHSDRQYIIGFNDGYEAAVQQTSGYVSGELRAVDNHTKGTD